MWRLVVVIGVTAGLLAGCTQPSTIPTWTPAPTWTPRPPTPTATPSPVLPLTPTPTTTSTPPSMSGDFATILAKHLTETGAVMYGAYWCGHCANQKALFGDAFKYIDYVECDPKGEDANPSLCAQKGIPGYPTWEIGGEFYSGEYSLEALAWLSDLALNQP